MRTWIFIFFTLFCTSTSGRRHVLMLKNDIRKSILCNQFGYFEGGYFSVAVEKMDGNVRKISLTFDKSKTLGTAGYLDSQSDGCFVENEKNVSYLSFSADNNSLVVHNQNPFLRGLIFEAGAINMGDDGYVPKHNSLFSCVKYALDSLHLVPGDSKAVAKELITLIQQSRNLYPRTPKLLGLQNGEVYPIYRLLRELIDDPVSFNLTDGRPYLQAVFDDFRRRISPSGSLYSIPYVLINGAVAVNFTVRFPTQNESGLYSVFIHNCAEVNVALNKRPAINLTMSMVEKNPTSYLSAGQQPLPLMNFVLCIAYLLCSLVWFLYLRSSRESVYRMHYLMLAVVLVKSISLMFHGINYYVIGKHGVHEAGWAVMYYITHIIRGALLFITILLIGAGWAFVKHMLTPRERSLFLFVIPLQIFANIATVVIEESEAGTARYVLWKDIFIFVDLVCCCIVIFPIVWSIRHLQAASRTDGKAAINLINLRLFRQFYVMVICYVYFTRIIAYLLTIMIPYSQIWIVELFKESVTFIFLITVGFKFRPITNNPYLLVPADDDDEEETVMERIQLEEVWSQSGATDGVVRLTRPQTGQNHDGGEGQTVRINPTFTDTANAGTALK